MRRYCVITPVRDEAEHLVHTIRSMTRQTVLPLKWVIVDDGSRDGTRTLLDEAEGAYRWIKGVRRADRGFRKPGAGVLEAFYDGYRLLSGEPWDFLVKLDGDLSFEPDYFERCLARFDAEAALGIGGGTICCDRNGEIRPEVTGGPAFHVRGATKIYRRKCWDSIAPVPATPGWDTADEVKANLRGWTTRTFHDIRLLQLKGTGAADGLWRNWFKNGCGDYMSGYHPVYMLGKCLKAAFRKPRPVVGLALAAGFLAECLKRTPRALDGDAIRYLRNQQVRYLLSRNSIYRSGR